MAWQSAETLSDDNTVGTLRTIITCRKRHTDGSGKDELSDVSWVDECMDGYILVACAALRPPYPR